MLMDLSTVIWRKSSYSMPAGEDCVEVAWAAPVHAVRDSKDPDGPVLAFGHEGWASFLSSVKAHDHDLP
ncbi:DUF397 domain-containing protein [Actinomadura sp. 6N118]|uniref:DUF397 domain-containing protein n=1 Tax=Actinomadura sp. 6N118 TaxID=3375151 RepID=UPI0037A8578A